MASQSRAEIDGWERGAIVMREVELKKSLPSSSLLKDLTTQCSRGSSSCFNLLQQRFSISVTL